MPVITTCEHFIVVLRPGKTGHQKRKKRCQHFMDCEEKWKLQILIILTEDYNLKQSKK
jgi:hypothetical protein